MLKKRIIPCLDVKNGRTVKGIEFEKLIDTGDPIEQAQLYSQKGADELCFLDITATHENRYILYDLVDKVAKKCFIPFTVGGGIKNVDDVRKLLTLGVDKVSINSATVYDPDIISHMSNIFGSQSIIVAVDAKYNTHKARYEIFTHGGRKETNIEVVEWCVEMQNKGAGEILLTSMDKDGTQSGFENKLNASLNNKISIPLIASGGGGEKKHFVQAIEKGKVDAVLAASVFHFGKIDIMELKQYMNQCHIPVRLDV